MQEWVDLHQNISKPFSKLTVRDRLQELKNKGKVQLGNPKVVAVGYSCLSLLSVSHNSNGVLQGWS